MFGESPPTFFLKQQLFFWPLCCKAQLCGVYGLKWSYGQILQSPLWSFAAPSGLSLGSLLHLWLMPSMPGPWGLVRGPIGRFVVVPYSFSFFRMDLRVLCGIFKVLDIFFKTHPWSVLLHNFVPDLFGELLGLHGAAFFLVPLASWCCRLWGLSEQVYWSYTDIMWQIMWHLDCTQVDFI